MTEVGFSSTPQTTSLFPGYFNYVKGPSFESALLIFTK